MNETLRLAGYAAEARFEALPRNVVERAKLLLLDQLACEIGVSNKPWLSLAAAYVGKLGGVPEASVVGSKHRTCAEHAAFANGALGHGFEIDDAYPPGLCHPGAVIVPASLAIAERDGLSGRELLTALVLGYEVMCRVGRSQSPTQLYRGFHPTSVSGPIGAAAAAGRLMGLDAERMAHAFAISASFCGGLTECYKSGGEIKRYHGGIGASAGIRAAMLARLGLTGPTTILEGPLGIRAFCDDFKPEELVAGLGEQHVVLDIWIKKYCCNGMIQAPLDAVELIRGRRPFAPHDVKRIVVGSNRHAINEVGSIREPRDIFGLQFSMAHTLAMQIVHGDAGPGRYVPAALRDTAIADLAARVSLETDPDIDRLFPAKVSGKVRIDFADGSTDSETVEDCRGTPRNPMSRADLSAKARAVGGLVFPAERIDRLIAVVSDLERVDNVRELGGLLAFP